MVNLRYAWKLLQSHEKWLPKAQGFFQSSHSLFTQILQLSVFSALWQIKDENSQAAFVYNYFKLAGPKIFTCYGSWDMTIKFYVEFRVNEPKFSLLGPILLGFKQKSVP